MNNFFTEKTPEERVQIDLTGCMHSVNLINQLVSANVHNEQVDNRVLANWRHINLVMKREHIVADTSDKTVFLNAIEVGKAFAPAPVVPQVTPPAPPAQ